MQKRGTQIFAYAQICYVLVIWGALQLFPGAETFSTMIALIGAWLLIAYTYKNCEHRNLAGWWTLLITTTALSIGIITNVHYFTTVSGGTTPLPVLNNPDAYKYYCDALASANLPGGLLAPPSQRGYGFIISCIWKLTGVTIVAPLILNMILILFCIIISGIISKRIIGAHRKHSSSWIATCAMIMTASICYYITFGTILLKEAPLCFSIALCALPLTSVLKKDYTSIPKSDFLYFFLGIIILATIRYSFILFILVAIIVATNKNSFGKRIVAQIMMATICLCALFISSNYLSSIAHNTLYKTAEIIDGNHSAYYFFSSEYHYAYDQVFGDYFSYPIWKRILCLPISAITQFLIPFPWNFGRDAIYGYTLDYAHIAYPWYLIGGLILYSLFGAWKNSSSDIRRATIMGFILWFIPAYLFAGTVSRYALPFVPLLIPAAVWVWDKCLGKKSLYIWGCIYCCLLAITLITCYYLQQSSIQ